MRVRTCNVVVVFSIFCLGVALSSAAQAADEVASPQYQAWAKFKPGSSATLSSDIKAGPNGQMTVHVDMTTTLVAVTPDHVEVDAASTAQVMGRGTNPNHIRRTIKAKEPAKDYQEAGTEDVKAMDKTFKCKVFKLTGDAAAANESPNRGGRAPANAKVTVYVSPEVPGGVVRMETVAEGAPSNTFILTAMNVK